MAFETLTEQEWERVQEVWDLLDAGRIEDARRELDVLLQQRPGHPDLRIVDAALLLEEGEPGRSLEALHGAERSADPAVFFHLRGLAEHDLLRFEAALHDGERALAVRADMPEAHDLVSRVLEHLGRWDAAADHAEQANALDPERYPLPLEMSDEEFDRCVERSIRELPAAVRKELDEIPVIVDALPERAMLAEDDPPLAPDLLGLFVGRHLLERSHGDVPAAPGAIHLFRRNLLRMCRTPDELAREIRITVQHEVGHLLGLDEDDLEGWGLA
jgi:predicted Zn-dependent protease with MMP-like domain